jgi:hypothetical protein
MAARPFRSTPGSRSPSGLSQLRGIQYDAALIFRARSVRRCWPAGRARPYVWERAAARKCRQHVLHAKSPDAAARMWSNRRWRWRERSFPAVVSSAIIPSDGGSLGWSFRWTRCGEQDCRPHGGAERVRDSQSRRGLGRKDVAGRALRTGCEELAKDGLCSLINYGPGEEELAVAVEAASEGAARRISCSISELIALTRRARLFIGGDTGPMHLAAALKIPVVAIFGPTNPARNGPFGTRSIVLAKRSSMTDHTRRREPEQGLLEITPAKSSPQLESCCRG